MKSDKELILNIKNNVDADLALNKLYELYAPVYYKIIHSHFNTPSNEAQKNELIKECRYHIFFAAKEFDFSKKIKFSSYLGNKARWICLNYFNKRKIIEKNSKETFDSNSPKDQAFNFLIENELLEKIKFEIKNESDFRVAKIFSMRYFDSDTNKLTSWKVISKELKMSIQGCINIHNKFIKKIKSKKII